MLGYITRQFNTTIYYLHNLDEDDRAMVEIHPKNALHCFLLCPVRTFHIIAEIPSLLYDIVCYGSMEGRNGENDKVSPLIPPLLQ